MRRRLPFSGRVGGEYYFANFTLTQQPLELTGNNTTLTSLVGTAVALSGDANTALVGGSGDSDYIGAAWAFARSGGGWTQQKLSGTGAEPRAPPSTEGSQQGFSAALSADGNTAIVGGPDDSAFALAYVKQHATTPELQKAALDSLIFKCNVLWSQLDALYFAYVEPALTPPGAFVPEPSASGAAAR